MGPEGLKRSLGKIQELLDKVYKTTKQLSPLSCADIISHCADSVLSGGVRRSALIVLFDEDDEEMFNCKTGNWFYENPQRARFNMSAALNRDTTSRETFEKIFKATREFGEPGFFWRSDNGVGCNPCQPAWAPVITKKGLSTIGEIKIGDEIWSETGWTKVLDKWSTGVKPVYEYRTTGGVFYGTENHKLVSKGVKTEAKDCKSVDNLSGEYVFDSIVYDANLEAKGFTLGNNTLPSEFMKMSKNEIRPLLRGLYSKNGYIEESTICYKTDNYAQVTQIQILLSYLGIESTFATLSEPGIDEYIIYISYDSKRFMKLIGFSQKELSLSNCEYSTGSAHTYPIKSVKLISEEEVFDITVDNETHTYWTGGLNVSNCAEVGFKPILNGQTGFQFCNLVTINGAAINTEEEFYEQCRNASTIATIQASYNKFPFLGNVTEELAKVDPLIGVSIGGIMCSPEILLNPDILRKGAQIVKEQNHKVANWLGINHSSRSTVIKPDGNSSVLLGMTPGCHGDHAKYYIRRVQVNKEEEAGQIYKKYNPKAVTESVWSTNHTDWCIQFPIIAKEGTIFKKDLLGITQLEVVQMLFNNWIIPGMEDENAVVQNNVSNTIQVPENDWDKVADWVWENRHSIAGVSFLPTSGDLDFNQPPYSEVLMPEQLLETYGDGVMFASGLIVDAIDAFGDLWKACDVLYGRGEKLNTSYEDAEKYLQDYNKAKSEDFLDKTYAEYIEASNKQYTRWMDLYVEIGLPEDLAEEMLENDIPIPISLVQSYLDKQMFGNIPKLSEKRDIIRRLNKFACKYFDCDINLMVKALKHVQLLHDWYELTDSEHEIEWDKVKWTPVLIHADETGAQGCAGGACEITKV